MSLFKWIVDTCSIESKADKKPEYFRQFTDSKNLDTILYMSGQNPKPEINPEFLRIYGHPLSMECERVFLTFGAINIHFQRCITDMTVTASWHDSLSEGTIPVLETPTDFRVYGEDVLL